MTSTSRRFAHTKWPEGLQNPPVVFSRSVAQPPGEWDNPAHGPLISTLRRTYGDDLIHLATEGTRYIHDVVAQLLDRDCASSRCRSPSRDRTQPSAARAAPATDVVRIAAAPTAT